MKVKIDHLKIVITAVFLLGGVTALSLAVGHHSSVKAPAVKIKAIKNPPVKPKVYDATLLKKFDTELQSLDFNNPSCTYSGLISVKDGTDSTNNVKNIKFLFCREGKSFYYQLGHTKTINQSGLNVFVTEDQKKVVVSHEDYVVKPPVTMVPVIENYLRSENYDLISKNTGSGKTLSILNERHVSCKELSVTYDTSTNKLSKIYARVTDLRNFQDKSRDRVMTLDIQTMDNKGDLDLHTGISDVVIKQRDGRWKLVGKYADYELITL